MGATVVVDDLRVVARAADGGETAIVKDVSFRIEPGEVLALIGESGSGKTTIGLSLMGYARRGCRIAGGTIRIGETDVLSLTKTERRDLRGRRVAYIAQSAAASFDPSRTIMGTGPLLYLVASQYVKAGAQVAAVLDTSPRSTRMKALPALAARPAVLWHGLKLVAMLRSAGVPLLSGISPIAVTGDDERGVNGVRVRDAQGHGLLSRRMRPQPLRREFRGASQPPCTPLRCRLTGRQVC